MRPLLIHTHTQYGIKNTRAICVFTNLDFIFVGFNTITKTF